MALLPLITAAILSSQPMPTFIPADPLLDDASLWPVEMPAQQPGGGTTAEGVSAIAQAPVTRPVPRPSALRAVDGEQG